MDQPYRSLLASVEILAAAAVSNALVLGSFVRDRGVKKAKFKFGSAGCDSNLDRPTTASQRAQSRSHNRGISWGSDIDLAEDMGMRLGPEFAAVKPSVARPAPAVVLPFPGEGQVSPGNKGWAFPHRGSMDSEEIDLKNKISPDYEPVSPMQSYQHMPTNGPRRVSFFDVGGLLGKSPSRNSYALPPDSPTLENGQNISMQPLLSSTRRQQQYQAFLSGGNEPPRSSHERIPRIPHAAGSIPPPTTRVATRSVSPAKSVTHGGGTWI